MSGNEFSHMIDTRFLNAAPVRLAASPPQCAALAARFGLVAVHALNAVVALEADGKVIKASGRLTADVVQACAVSGEDLPVLIDEPVAMRFVPAGAAAHPDAEIELAAEDCDEIEFTGHTFDLGEEMAQAMAVALDPYAVGPQAEEARRKAGLLAESASGPFAALAALKGTK